jgi:hypothetical protein
MKARADRKTVKSSLRQRGRELRDLLNEWDPIGCIPSGAPPDEYECLLLPLMRRLESGEPVETMVAFLEEELRDHFGLGPYDYGTEAFVRRAKAWYEGGRRGSNA